MNTIRLKDEWVEGAKALKPDTGAMVLGAISYFLATGEELDTEDYDASIALDMIMPSVKMERQKSMRRRELAKMKKAATEEKKSEDKKEIETPASESMALPVLDLPEEKEEDVIPLVSPTVVPKKNMLSRKDAELAQLITSDWNRICVSLPKIRVINATRMEQIKRRLAEMAPYGDGDGYVVMKECFYQMQNSKVCTGASIDWKADFSWFISSPNNWVKVFEGKYKNNNYEKQHKDKTLTEIIDHDQKLIKAYHQCLEKMGVDSDKYTPQDFLRDYNKAKENNGRVFYQDEYAISDEEILQQEIDEQLTLIEG